MAIIEILARNRARTNRYRFDAIEPLTRRIPIRSAREHQPSIDLSHHRDHRLLLHPSCLGPIPYHHTGMPNMFRVSQWKKATTNKDEDNDDDDRRWCLLFFMSSWGASQLLQQADIYGVHLGWIAAASDLVHACSTGSQWGLPQAARIDRCR